VVRFEIHKFDITRTWPSRHSSSKQRTGRRRTRRSTARSSWSWWTCCLTVRPTVVSSGWTGPHSYSPQTGSHGSTISSGTGTEFSERLIWLKNYQQVTVLKKGSHGSTTLAGTGVLKRLIWLNNIIRYWCFKGAHIAQ
jgi:hypothetical protein